MTKKRDTFPIRKKPQKPTRKTNIKKTICYLWDVHMVPVSKLEAFVKKSINKYYQEYPETIKRDYKNLFVDVTHGWESCDIAIIGQYDESDEDFNRRMTNYKTRLKEYNIWYKSNKDKIEAELKRRADKKKKTKDNQIAKLEKQLKELKSK